MKPNRIKNRLFVAGKRRGPWFFQLVLQHTKTGVFQLKKSLHKLMKQNGKKCNGSCFEIKHSMTLAVSQTRSGELRTQKLNSHLVRTKSLNVLPLKPGVGQHIAIYATRMPGISSLLISTLPVHSPAFFSKSSPDFSCVGCG